MPASATSSRRALPAVLALLPALAAQEAAREEVTARYHLRYHDGADACRRHHLDLFLPADPPSPPPLVMFLHGGAWWGGDKEWIEHVGHALARAGVACALVNYRLSPQVRHPAHVVDCARALAWLHARAEAQGWDRNRLFVAGHSAGGHLAALLALDGRYLRAEGLRPREVVRGVITLSAPFDVRPDLVLYRSVFGPEAAERAAASPLLHVHDGAPPFLVVWARHDLIGLESGSEAMVAALRDRDVPVRDAEIDGRTHRGMVKRIGTAGDRTTRLVLDFVRRGAEPR